MSGDLSTSIDIVSVGMHLYDFEHHIITLLVETISV